MKQNKALNSTHMDWSILFVLLDMREDCPFMFIVTHCYRLASFYLIYDPRVNPDRIQSRVTIGPSTKRHSDGPAVPRFYVHPGKFDRDYPILL